MQDSGFRVKNLWGLEIFVLCGLCREFGGVSGSYPKP